MKNIFRKLGFTAGETVFTAFLILTFIAGIIIKLSGWNRPDNFNYSGPDKKYEEKIKQDFELLKHQSLDGVQKERSVEIKNLADSLLTNAENQKNNKEVKIDRIININNALAADLMLLPGIGEVTAERIIEYREKNDRFRKIDDLKKVKGIGDKKFEKIKVYITVE